MSYSNNVIRSNNLNISEDTLNEIYNELTPPVSNREEYMNNLILERLHKCNETCQAEFCRSLDRLVNMLENGCSDYKKVSRSINTLSNSAVMIYKTLRKLYDSIK